MIVTSEDPRNEPIESITNAILAGVSDARFAIFREPDVYTVQIEKNQKYIFVIPDRKKAIAYAICLAQKGDLVLLTGKGHEKSMNYGKGEEPWDENEIAKQALHDRKLL
jgi:UDP-N-acetylmuramoyl-L-alanyl-D-glutamate--2,6-diaminopimelate ligase